MCRGESDKEVVLKDYQQFSPLWRQGAGFFVT